jgi:hypothetical protein
MSKVYNYKSKLHFTKFRELDDFIQNSLDKFFFVEPWKKLYENTGIFSRYIISNKSTIPDLIIFNKTFNKNDCYEGADRNYFNKFPRMRFILRPRYKQFYNPCDTIGKDESFFIGNKNFNSEKRVSGKNNNYKNQNNKYMKPLKKYIPEGDFEDGFILSKLSPDNIFETNNNPKDNNNPNEEKKEEKENKKNETIEFNLSNKIPEKKIIPQSKVNEEQYDDEEEPEWENDDVNNYTTRITFQEIPKDLKEKAVKEIDKREKVDVYNNKILQTLNVDNKIDNNDKNETEEILKFDENKNGNIFEQLESFLKSDEKKTENQNENFNNNFFDKYNNNSNNNIFNNNFSFNFNKSKKKNNLMYNNNLNVNNINQNLQLQNLQLRYQIQQQQAQQAQLQLYFLQQQQYLNYIQMQNLQNQIKGFYIPNNNQRNPMINMNMNMNFSLNNNNNNNSNIEGANNNNNKINFNNDENEEEDPMMNDFTTDSKYYNPTVFLENPALIVKKNLIEKNWFLMRDGKILGNYNSEELLFLLDEKIKEGNSFNNISISDYQTDVVFQPKILYEILKEHVSKIKKKYLESKFLNQVNNSNNNSNINSMSPFNSLNGNINQLFH